MELISTELRHKQIDNRQTGETMWGLFGGLGIPVLRMRDRAFPAYMDGRLNPEDAVR